MFKPKVFKFYNKHIWLVIFLAIFVLFQNCGEIHLAKLEGEKIPSVIQEFAGGELPIPKSLKPNARVVIVVDQSFSMVWDKCPSDLDGTNPHPQHSAFHACQRGPGVDQPAYRLEVIKKWLDDLAEHAQSNPNVKVMILPFSGGKAKRPRGLHQTNPAHNLRDPHFMRFVNIPQAKNWLNALKQEQALMIQNGALELMGTTEFSPILQYARSNIINELNLLKQSDELDSTAFEFVFISDGAYKPTMYLFNKLRSVSGCPDCNLNPEHIACNWGAWSGPIHPRTYCQNLQQNFRQYYGIPEENELEKVSNILNDILELPELPKYNGLKLNMKFAKVNWLAVPQEDKNTTSNKTKNLFDEIQKNLVKEIPVYNIASANKPFSILSGGSDSLTYILQNIYAINTNVFVDRYGNLQVDSDGDGVPDSVEISLGLDPQSPRSNGYCLDIIAVNFGCQTIACDPNIDRDRDGLNECEEATIGTKDYLFDSDNDNIPDYFEVIRGLNPNFNDSNTSSSGDRYSDHDHFRAGISKHIPFRQVQSRHKVQLETHFEGYNIVEDESGIQHAVGVYTLDLKNLPLLPTLAIPEENIIITKDGINGNTIPLEKRIDTIAREENHNRVIFLMQITSIENPGKTSWHILVKDVPVDQYGSSYTIGVDFNFSEFIQIQGSL